MKSPKRTAGRALADPPARTTRGDESAQGGSLGLGVPGLLGSNPTVIKCKPQVLETRG